MRGRRVCGPMRQEAKEWLLLVGKSILLVVGGILVVAALVELFVGGFSLLALGVLAMGLALAVPPLAFAWLDALREARKGRA